jgi:hypothetical protein
MAFVWRGLGAAAPLTPDQIYATAIGAGFPPSVATQMTAIALRESGGRPDATFTGSAANPNSESSWGLWQINIQGNPTLMAQLGITDPSQLLDPATNARAAYALYGGNPNNLNVAWYINRPGVYQSGYEANLPAAEQAAADYASGGDTAGSGPLGLDLSSLGLDLSNFDLSNVSPLAWGVGAVLLAAVVFGGRK